MSRVTCIVGLPGSGKTAFAKKAFSHAILFDDIKEEHLEHLYNELISDAHIVITDPFLCMNSLRPMCHKNLKDHGADSIEWIYFANDPKAAIANVDRRNDGRKVKGFIRDLAVNYKPPEGATILPVWKPE